MNKRDAFILCACLFLCAVWLRAQDVLPLTASTTVMQSPLPTSVRASGPFDDAHPGIEGQFGTDQGDPNHIYIFHLNHWRYLTLTTAINS